MAGHVDQARHIVAMCVPRMAPDVQARQGNYQLGKATFGKARQHCRFVVCLHAASGPPKQTSPINSVLYVLIM